MDEEELLRNKNISHGLISPGYLENIFPDLIFQKITKSIHSVILKIFPKI